MEKKKIQMQNLKSSPLQNLKKSTLNNQRLAPNELNMQFSANYSNKHS